MAKATQPIPAGCHSITPHLIARDALKAIDFYKQAFAAQECSRMLCPATGSSLTISWTSRLVWPQTARRSPVGFASLVPWLMRSPRNMRAIRIRRSWLAVPCGSSSS